MTTTPPTCTIAKWDLTNKTVFLRIDGNVPLQDGAIQDDFRLKAVLPTIKLLRSKGALITIATHLGRPKGKPYSKYSTRILADWFAQHGFGPAQNVQFLENLRFDPREQESNQEYAHELKDSFDYYVNDAWGTFHRKDTSIALLPKLFPPDRRSIGLLVEKELTALAELKNNPKKPYVVLLGGGKGSSKIPVIEHLIALPIHQRPTAIALLPAIVFTFLHAQGKPVGKSLVDDTLLDQAQDIIKTAQKQDVELVFPQDYLYTLDSWNDSGDGPLKTCLADDFPAHGYGIAVGPQSLDALKAQIKQACTVFYNGAMGNPKNPATMEPMRTLLQAMAQSDAYTVVGGGNSIAEVQQMGLMDQISYCSTGGGATLAYISGEKLPGLQL